MPPETAPAAATTQQVDADTPKPRKRAPRKPKADTPAAEATSGMAANAASDVAE